MIQVGHMTLKQPDYSKPPNTGPLIGIGYHVCVYTVV